MRLTDHQIHIIKQKTTECFGAEAVVLLFGSRADDNARGGDIDLYIDLPAHTDQVFARGMRLNGAPQIALYDTGAGKKGQAGCLRFWVREPGQACVIAVTGRCLSDGLWREQ
uniref:Nucleotidyltransferase domain-containing protein n=1 Tax=Candidatus Kentrum sp. DK TaxID=2126562 RepID=A0A450RYC9_9GAMM|nr:MAG: hypothetical protein BECKDK2373B_GA0170837_100753 [Candidatus Kentron sp. DK]